MDIFGQIKKFNVMQFLLLAFSVFPILTYAVEAPTNLKSLIMIVVNLITAILPVIILLAFIYFVWGLTKYLKNTGENREEAQHMMISGVIGFFIMTAVWSFVGILSATLGTDTKKPNLKGAEDYLTGVGVEKILKESEKERKEKQQEFKKTEARLIKKEDKEQNSHIPQWFKKALPWNWGK